MVASRRYSRYIPIIFFVADLISFNLSFFLAVFTKFGIFFKFDHGYLALQFILNLLWFSIFIYSRLYEPKRELNLVEQLNRVFTALFLNLFFVFTLWFAFKPYEYSRAHLFYLYAYFSIYVVIWRSVWYYAIRYYRATGHNLRNIVIAGCNQTTRDLKDYFQVNRGIGYNFVGFFGETGDGSVSLGKLSVESILEFTNGNNIDVIFLYTPYFDRDSIKRIIRFAENNLIKVKLISQISNLGYSNIAISNYGSIPTLHITALPLDQRINRLVKRVFDMVFAGFILLFVLSWLIPLIGLLIKLDSPGPIFFRQERNGRDNKIFRIYKFRTMRVHKDQHVKQAQKHDPRITKLGIFLRKTSLDEFPQFINVLLGEMSVIGPRPHAVPHNTEFRKQIDRFIQRHAVKPGITGLAQCKGFRGETSTFHSINGRVRYDRFYVKNWSLFLDFKIIFLTIISLMKGNENAY
jgi:putative colanic acid biosynthesis UDP-glucose lipid carrier transferase